MTANTTIGGNGRESIKVVRDSAISEKCKNAWADFFEEKHGINCLKFDGENISVDNAKRMVFDIEVLNEPLIIKFSEKAEKEFKEAKAKINKDVTGAEAEQPEDMEI